VRWLVALVLCVGCYSPTFSAGGACDTDCPGDLVCIDHICREPGYVPMPDGGTRDMLGPIDMLDGPPGDADADGVDDATDNCPAKANLDQHDEDADAIGDVCDPCPHLAGTAVDGDGDGVGDACDPQPTVAKQRIKFFDPFTTDRPEWTHDPTVTRVGETLRINSLATYSGTVLAIANGETRVATGGSVVSIAPGAAEHQLAILFGLNQTSTVYHYCEFYDTGGATGDIAITRANMGTYTSFALASYTGTLPLGVWSMGIDASVAAQRIAMTGRIGGSPYGPLMSGLSTPALVTSNRFQVDANGIDVRLDYFLVVETLP
jgi:hypothetical protein